MNYIKINVDSKQYKLYPEVVVFPVTDILDDISSQDTDIYDYMGADIGVCTTDAKIIFGIVVEINLDLRTNIAFVKVQVQKGHTWLNLLADSTYICTQCGQFDWRARDSRNPRPNGLCLYCNSESKIYDQVDKEAARADDLEAKFLDLERKFAQVKGDYNALYWVMHGERQARLAAEAELERLTNEKDYSIS